MALKRNFLPLISGKKIDANRVAAAADHEQVLVDVIGLLRSDSFNLIVIRRQSGLGLGGCWKSVKLLAEKYLSFQF